MATPNETIVTDEQKDETRFKELNTKTDRNEDENKELGEIKERYGKRMQGRVDKLTWEKKTAQEETERLRIENEELKAKPKEEIAKPQIVETTVTVGDKQFYTDEALRSKIDSGQMTETEAYKHQRTRDKAEMKTEVLADIKKEGEKETWDKARAKDAEKVLGEYPEFNPKHQNHNPEDSLFKLATELYNEGLGVRADGFSKSIQRAKEILGHKMGKPDLSKDLNLASSSASVKTGNKDIDNITLSEDEQEAAIRMYTLGDAPKNPKTEKSYTEKEALAKALESKKARLRRI